MRGEPCVASPRERAHELGAPFNCERAPSHRTTAITTIYLSVIPAGTFLNYAPLFKSTTGVSLKTMTDTKLEGDMPPAIDHRPPTIEHHPPSITLRPSPTEHRSPTIDHSTGLGMDISADRSELLMAVEQLFEDDVAHGDEEIDSDLEDDGLLASGSHPAGNSAGSGAAGAAGAAGAGGAPAASAASGSGWLSSCRLSSLTSLDDRSAMMFRQGLGVLILFTVYERLPTTRGKPSWTSIFNTGT